MSTRASSTGPLADDTFFEDQPYGDLLHAAGDDVVPAGSSHKHDQLFSSLREGETSKREKE